MTNTSLGFPRPVATDQIALGYDQISDLADAINAYLVGTGWSTSLLTPGTDWSQLNSRVRKTGSTVYLHVELTRLNTVKSAPASGDMGNETVLTIPAGFRPAHTTAFSFIAATRTNGGGHISPGGAVQINSMNSDSTINVGDVLYIDATYMAD